MAENDSDKKQPWLVPVVVAVVGAISTVAVALINKPSSSQESTSKSEAHTLQAVNPEGIKLFVSKGETLTIEASGEVHTNPKGTVPECDILAEPNGLPRCHYNTHGLPFMALIGEFNGIPEFIGSKKTMVFHTNGTFLLKINDWDYRDNAGSFEISVTRK